jgi:hypothetical protein
VIFPSFHTLGTKPWHIDELNIVVIDFDKFGFISGRSTTLQLLKVMDEWTKILDKGGKIDSVYMDFMKAFDKVPHSKSV